MMTQMTGQQMLLAVALQSSHLMQHRRRRRINNGSILQRESMYLRKRCKLENANINRKW